jgi:hypothetical protein
MLNKIIIVTMMIFVGSHVTLAHDQNNQLIGQHGLQQSMVVGADKASIDLLRSIARCDNQFFEAIMRARENENTRQAAIADFTDCYNACRNNTEKINI